jgi:hypothetical protein
MTWIELFFRLSPDNNSGTTEAAIFLVFCAAGWAGYFLWNQRDRIVAATNRAVVTIPARARFAGTPGFYLLLVVTVLKVGLRASNPTIVHVRLDRKGSHGKKDN